MSLLLEALKKAERDKLGEREIPVQGNTVRKKANAKLFSERTSGETLELVPENSFSSSNIPKQQTEQQTDQQIETISSQNRIAAQNIFLANKDQSSRINIGRVGKWIIFSGTLLIVMIGGAYYVWEEVTYLTGSVSQTNEHILNARRTSRVSSVPSQAKTITSPEQSDLVKETVATPGPENLGKTQIASRSSVSNDKVDVEKVSVLTPEKNISNVDIVDTSASLSPDTTEKPSELSASEMQEAIRNSVDKDSYSSKNPIEIKRTQMNNGVSEELKAAYQAYINGDLEIARQYYLKELDNNPRNKDVLLGLAAIATRLQQVNNAQAYYLRILELDPRDSSAIAAMSGLVQADPNQTESHLKNLLAQQPNAAALHFALGNNYVTQLRWAEAQQSFFRALSADPGNADYAFNLAVSLDHLRKNELASKYYSEALALADRGPAGFKEIQVIERLKELTN